MEVRDLEERRNRTEVCWNWMGVFQKEAGELCLWLAMIEKERNKRNRGEGQKQREEIKH